MPIQYLSAWTFAGDGMGRSKLLTPDAIPVEHRLSSSEQRVESVPHALDPSSQCCWVS